MKKLILLGLLVVAGAGAASADDFSFSLNFGGGGRYYRPRPVRYVQQPVYSSCAEPVFYRPGYYSQGFYRPGFYGGGRHQQRVVYVRSCN